MIGGPVGRSAYVEGDAAARRRLEHVDEAAATVGALDDQPVVAEATDHVEVEHRDRLGEGDGGLAYVVAGAEEAELFAAEEREDERTGRAAGGREGAGEPHHDRGARRVVVGAGVHDAVLGPQMVVVGADHDRLGRERRVGPREDPDDIHAAPLLVAEVDPQTRAHARSERGRGLAADRGRDESDPGGGRVERWQRVADEQERRRAAPLRRDELLEPRHAPAVRGPVEDQDDLAVDVHARPVVAAPVRSGAAVAGEDHLAGDFTAR